MEPPNPPPLFGKTLLVVNTGSHQKRYILQRLDKLGIKLIIINKEKNWAQPYAHDWIIAETYSTNDTVQSIKDYISKNPDKKIEGAIAFLEEDMPLLAKICAEFKFIGNVVDTSLNTRNKFKMQEIFKMTGLPFVKQHLLKNRGDLDEAMKTIKFPAVIKPVSGNESQFVVYVANEKEAIDAYNYQLSNCTPDFDPIYRFNKKQFLYQEYIEGHEFSLECYCQHGIPHVVGIHEKIMSDLPFFVETGDYSPPRVSDEDDLDIITKMAESVLIVLKVRDSLAHVEIKLTKNGPKIVEVESHMGSDYIYQNIEELYNVDLIKLGAQISLGINVDYKPKEPKDYIVSKYFMPDKPGVITKIRGFDDLENNKDVVDAVMFKEVGDTILLPPDGYDHIGWVSVKGSSFSDADKIMEDIFEKVNVEITPFKSYSLVGKTVRKSGFFPALINNKKGLERIYKLKNIDQASREKLRKLHIGIACNIYSGGNAVEQDLMSVGKNIEKTLVARGYKVSFFDFNNLVKVVNDLHASDVDIIFNVCERVNNSSLLEPHAASILDVLQIPYTGSNPFTLALCIDKIRVKKLLAYHGIPTPKWDYAYTLDDDIDDNLRFPLIVKPANTDNSIGITNDSVVTNKKDLGQQLQKILIDIGSPALVEEYIEGDEYDVSIMGSDEDDLLVLPLARSLFKNMPEGYWHIFPYDSKFSNDPAYGKIIMQKPPKNVPKKFQSLISEISLDTYRILDCHDYGRVELRVDEEGNPFVLELNPNPSINVEDSTPHVAEIAGMDYGDFLEEIIRMTVRRYKNRPPYYHLQTNIM